MLLLQRGSRSSSNNSTRTSSTRTSSKPSVQKRSTLLQLCCAAPAVAEGDLGQHPADSSPSADAEQPAAQLQKQQPPKEQQCRLSIDVRAPLDASGMVPLTQGSLSTATALFGGFSRGCNGPKHHQDTKDSPSEIHSDLQHETKALCSSSTCTTSSSSQQPRSTPPPSNASSPQQQLPSCHPSDSRLPGVENSNLQQQQESSAALLPHKQHVQALQQQCSQAADGLGAVALTPAAAAGAAAAVMINQHKHSSLVTVSTSCQATTSSVAGWSETVIPQPAAATATTAHVATATASQDAGAAEEAAATPDCSDILTLPPELTGKLRKLESGLSFRMLQPELSGSFQASDALTKAGSKSGSTSFGLLSPSDSSTAAGSGLGTVSRRSTGGSGLARLSTQSLQAQNPSSSSTEEGPLNPAGCGALPATIPEHVCVTVGASGLAATTSAAVAAAFEADAAALQGLVAAAAELPPVPKPHHSRSKSAGALDIPAAADQSAGAAASGSGSVLAAAGHVILCQPAGGPSSTPVVSAGATQTATAAAAATAVVPNSLASAGAKTVVMRTLSASSSPFAQMDLQQTVTAALINHHHQQQQQQQRPPAPAFPTAATAAGAAARPASAAGAPAGSRASSSSYRSTPPYSLQSIVQVQQQAGSFLSAPAHQNQILPVSNSLRPSLTSKLSWASGVTAAAEQQGQVFALLAQPQGFAGGSSSDRSAERLNGFSAGQQQEGEEEGSVGRGILQPSKSLSQSGSSTPRSFLRAAKSFSSLPSFGRAESAGSSSSISISGNSLEKKASDRGGKGKGSGAFRFQRVKSAAALLSGLKGLHSQPTPATATATATATAAGPTSTAAAAVVGTSPDGRGSNGARSSSSGNSGLTAAVSASASPLRSILRLPSNRQVSSKHRARVSLGAATPLQAPTQQQQQQQQQQEQEQQEEEEEGVLMLAASSNRSSSLLAVPGAARSPLPPLPRPHSGLGLDTVAAAAATVSGSSSSAAEGPFAVPQPFPGLLDSLLPAAAATSSRRSITVTSAHPSTLRQTASTSIGQVSSSGSSSGIGGSLICLAVTRLHSAAATAAAASAAGSCGSLATAGAASSSVLASQQSSSLPGLDSASLSGLPSSSGSTTTSKSSTEAARAFAEAFLAALASGNVKWASEKAVGELLAESAKMVGLDRQLYVGKAAIIRRLNGGMDQLVKMAQATATDSSSSSSGADAAAAAAEGRLAARLPIPHLTVSCPDPKGRPSVVEAVYTFKWGIRKLTMRDEFIVRGRQILRLRRSRG